MMAAGLGKIYPLQHKKDGCKESATAITWAKDSIERAQTAVRNLKCVQSSRSVITIGAQSSTIVNGERRRLHAVLGAWGEFVASNEGYPGSLKRRRG